MPQEIIVHLSTLPKNCCYGYQVCFKEMFVSSRSDKAAFNEEHEVTSSNNGQELKAQMTSTQELYAFVADDKNKEECNNVSS